MRNVIDENAAPSPEQGVTGVTLLNQLMALWLADGINLQYESINAADLQNDINIPEYAEMGVTANLATRLVAGGTLTPELGAMASTGYDTILRIALNAKISEPISMRHIPKGSAQYRRY